MIRSPKSCVTALACLLGLTLAAMAPAAAAAPIAAGQALPAVQFDLPGDAAEAAYLGLRTGPGRFGLTEIRGAWQLIQVFNMYCAVCQTDSARVNQLYDLVRTGDLNDRLVMLGIGAGNSDFEVGVFRRKTVMSYPAFSDKDFAAHKALGEPRTPYFILVRQGQVPQVVFTHLGPIGEPGQFLAMLAQKMSQP